MPVQRQMIALLRAEHSKLRFKQTDARVRNSKPSFVPCYFFLRACMQPSGKRTISCNSPGSCLATGRTSVGQDLTARNSEERIRQKVILPSMFPIQQ